MTDRTGPIALMGNPNIGKSAVFSRLTNARVIVSNYPGSTVDFSEGRLRLERDSRQIVDPPGAYSLQASNRAEEVAVHIMKQAGLIINVVDATNLERNLYLTLELLEAGKPMIVALNMWDEARHHGIEIDVEALEKALGVPVVPTVALTGEGIRDLTRRLAEARIPAWVRHRSDEERWMEIGKIIGAVQTVRHRHHTFADVVSEATIKPWTGIPLAALFMAAAFWIVRFVGENLIRFVLDPVFEWYRPLAMKLSDYLGSGLVRDVLIGHLIDAQIDYAQSLGLLTTALYVPFAMVLPYIIAFYVVLAVLEDSGYLPRLATLMDNVFHKLGMHGYGIIPACLGLGCNVAGVLAARTMETRKQRFICCTLVSIATPCMAQSAMIVGILGRHGPIYMLMVFLSLLSVYIVGGVVMKAMVKGESPEIFLEIPPYRRPSVLTIIKKTLMRVRWFLLDAIPWLFVGVLLINILYATGFLPWLSRVTAPVVEFWLGLPREAATALLAGFLRKDLAVGMLLPLEAEYGMSPQQLVIAVTVLTIYFPCAATFAVLLKELGVRDMLKASGIMLGTAMLVGGLLRLALIGLPA